MLTGAKKSANIIYNSPRKDFNIEKVIIEKLVSLFIFLQRRIKKLGRPVSTEHYRLLKEDAIDEDKIMWTHPTLWEYIWFRLSRGVK
jgi:hypothetical protein